MVLATYFTHVWVCSDLPCDVVFGAAVLLSAALFVLVPAFDAPEDCALFLPLSVFAVEAPVLCVLLWFTAVEVLFFVLLLLSELFFFTVLSVSLLSADEDAAASDVSDFDVPEPGTFSPSFTAVVSSDCVSPAVSAVLSVLFCVSDTVASCVSDCILLLLLPAVPHEAAENTTVIASIAVMIFLFMLLPSINVGLLLPSAAFLQVLCPVSSYLLSIP